MKAKEFTGGWRIRPKEATPQKALELKQMGLKLKDMAKMWGITPQQVFNLIQQAKNSKMTPDERNLSRALDCQEWLRQFVQAKYEGKVLRRLNLYLREIRSILEREIPCLNNPGSESTGKNLAKFAQEGTGAPIPATENPPAA